MESPKLALIPSGYKSGTVYSILPTDGVGDFDFSRIGQGATRVRKDGLIETMSSNTPRLDYSNGDCPSLLLEPQRTNDFTYSEEFNQSAWFKSNSTVTTNQITAPDGTLTGDLLTSTGSNGGVFRFGTWSTTQKTISFFVKKDTSTTAEIYNASSPTNRVLFNLDNGTITTQGGTMTGKIKDFGSGWFRISATHTATGNQTFGLKPQTNQRIFIWGAQSENASYSTSYIKTIVQIQSRQKDICINGGDADLSDITEGTFFIDVTPFKASTYHRITLSNNTSNEEIIFLFYSNNTQVQIISESGGSGQVSYTTNITFDTKNKLAFTFKNNEFKFYVNGNLVHTDTSGNIATGLNSLHFAGNNGGFNYFQGKVHDTRVYDRVLTQAEAVELTTI